VNLGVPRLAAVDAALEAMVVARQFVGIAALAWRNGRLVHSAGYGVQDFDTGVPMSPSTIVRAYSMTKPVMAVVMMSLLDEGRWSPDDPITRFIPEFADLKVFHGLDGQGVSRLEPASRPPTMQELMTHTAGFGYGGPDGPVDAAYVAAEVWTSAGSDDFVRRVAALPLYFEPGSAWRYSIAMDLQGVIAERITGRSLGEVMAERIFSPLGMADTGFTCPSDQRHRLAALYRWKDGALKAVRNAPMTGDGLIPPAFLSGGGGLFSTAEDYMYFARMLLGRGALEDVRIISEASAARMMTSQLAPDFVARRWGVGFQRIRPGYEYGYNGVVVTDPTVARVKLGRGTYLWDGMASTWFWVDPEHDVTFVGMLQRIGDEQMPLVQPISQTAVAEALGLG
jgi:CubicO group peptidase (beta-lactamase class C family)